MIDKIALIGYKNVGFVGAFRRRNTDAGLMAVAPPVISNGMSYTYFAEM
jgi:hypothetical protein